MKRTPEEKLLNPRPGSKIAEARDFGSDLTQIVENLRLSPEKRIEKLQNAMIGFEDVLRVSEKWKIYDYDVQILSIDGLISAKESAGREKDQPGLKILYALREASLDEE